MVVVGEQGDETRHRGLSQYTPSPSDTQIIRGRSACLGKVIERNPGLPTHLWPDQNRGISQSSLYYVICSLARGAPTPQGRNQLQELSDICHVIWILRCRKEPFQDAANHILGRYNGVEADETEAKCLSMIAFVLGRDDELRGHLKNLIWQCNSTLDLPIECLLNWVHGGCTLSLHRTEMLTSGRQATGEPREGLRFFPPANLQAACNT